jgi:hypothetical protein
MRTIQPEQDPLRESEETRESPAGRQGRRIPFWLGALLLLAGLLVFLGGMRWLINQPGGMPATPAAPAQPATAPTSAVVAPAPTSPPVPTRAPAAAPTLAPTIAPTRPPTPVPTLEATVLPTTKPSIEPTVEPTLAAALSTSWWTWQSNEIDAADEQEVLAAVDLSWQVLGEAWWNVDPVRLHQAFSDPYLSHLTDAIVASQAEGRAATIEVDRQRTEVRFLNNDTAVVYDEYINHATAVDITTRQPVEQRPSDLYKDFDLFRRIDGTWKIVSGVRQP